MTLYVTSNRFNNTFRIYQLSYTKGNETIYHFWKTKSYKKMFTLLLEHFSSKDNYIRGIPLKEIIEKGNQIYRSLERYLEEIIERPTKKCKIR